MPSVSKHYSEALLPKQKEDDPLKLSPAKLGNSNRRLLAFLERELGNSLREPHEILAGMMELLLRYADSMDGNMESVIEALTRSQDLRGLRNKYMHVLREPVDADISQAKAAFARLEPILPADDYQKLTEANPYAAINDMLREMLLYWTD